MSISLLRLPTDIPWERVCVSGDMDDLSICDKRFPPKWNSSVAVFRYKPDDEYQEFPNHEVIYFKVAVTITGYQPRDAEIEGQIDWGDLSVQTIGEVEDLLNEYHPCTGAIVQVSVAPSAKSESGATLPYFLDFQPKKRELFEMATDTKERMSRSLESLSIGKSASTAHSLEVLDVDMGGSFTLGAEGSYAGTGGGLNIGTSSQGQWGTKQVGANESAVNRTTDQATERRETSAFTTQLSQLYHLLDSYHLGTNRAIFFIQPRPHTLEEPTGFVRGPRPVEGIQEFFLVVAKPKDQKDVCVSVRVDTAHLAEMPIMEYAYKKDSISLSVSAAPPASNDAQAVFDGYDYMDVSFITKIGERRYKCYRKTVEQVENYTSPWPDYKIDISDSGGYVITSQSASHGSHSVNVSPDGEYLTAKVWATSRKCYDDGGTTCVDCPDTWHARSANSSLSLVVNLKSREPIRQVGTEQVLLVTTRGLCCCSERTTRSRPGLLDVIPLGRSIAAKGVSLGLSNPEIVKAATPVFVRGGSPQPAQETTAALPAELRLTAKEANAMADLIRMELNAAVAPGRPEGREPVPYLLHDYFLDKLEARLRPYQRVGKGEAKPLPRLPIGKDRLRDVERYFGKPVGELKSADLRRISTGELARVTGLPRAEAAALRLSALGIELKPVPGGDSSQIRQRPTHSPIRQSDQEQER